MQAILDHDMNESSSVVSRKWTAKQKSNSKRIIAPPTSDDYSQRTVDQLKLECTQRKLDVAKGTNKEGRVNVLNMYDQNTATVTSLINSQRVIHRKKSKSDPEERRKAGTMLRLVNVLFSDELFEEFMSTGDRLTRKQLDEGGNKFWSRVADEFNAAKTEYDKLISNDDRIVELDPSDGGILSATKLSTLWKELSGLFAKAVAKSKVSGEHSSSFWDFCNKRVDVYYLHLDTEERNAGREFCSSNLFEHDEFDSIDNEHKPAMVCTPSKRKQSSSPVVKHDDIIASIAKSVSILAESDQKQSARESCFGSISRLEASIERVTKRITAIETEITELEQKGLDMTEALGDRKRLKLHHRQLEIKLEETEHA
ncbi:hypothetical protein Ae201684P_021442 [Aphanomyces euteiches]|uniref:Uncharacterized protein n=1 Tax=Aphanomyces euteiches TaxID=100861 RepID=A0A6G0X7T2_9STRA|nr:hypothetical protein Ae201684_007681 [Aphanomyces euteiches]KAH9067281.1 hypothetical protein Ae201684P_021442 [Aphanomyces euteiches]KAH9144538.1 hypothetical protein AeRB84_011519 [Aphanomyces euteiches]